MKFFSPYSPRIPTISRPIVFMLAVLIATTLWYIVVYHDTADFEIEIILNYRGLPPKLFVTSGMVYRVRERIRGPRMLRKALPETVDLPIDISGLKVGDAEPSNVFSVVDEQRKLLSSTLRRAFKIIYIEPAVIRLTAEYIDRINMPVNLNFVGDSKIVIRKISHQSVALHGPASEIKKLERMSVFPINVNVDFSEVGKNVINKDVPVIIPPELDCPHVTPEPSSIKVEYIVKGERLEVVGIYPVTLSVADSTMYKVTPNIVQLKMTIPSNKKNDTNYLNKLKVTALPPDLKIGESKSVPLNFTPPDGLEVVNEQQSVIITRILSDDHKTPETLAPVKDVKINEKPKPEQLRNARNQRRSSSSSRRTREEAPSKASSSSSKDRRPSTSTKREAKNQSSTKPKTQASPKGKETKKGSDPKKTSETKKAPLKKEAQSKSSKPENTAGKKVN
ncbi:MAG: hypothetical protein IJU40_01445 [Desulfovibrionaceae bacterium]|nr:hypothetical protein [Desulfovibrionaceae bacterium]